MMAYNNIRDALSVVALSIPVAAADPVSQRFSCQQCAHIVQKHTHTYIYVILS